MELPLVISGQNSGGMAKSWMNISTLMSHLTIKLMQNFLKDLKDWIGHLQVIRK